MKSDNVALHSEGRGGISQEYLKNCSIEKRKSNQPHSSKHTAAAFFINAAELIEVIVDSPADPTQNLFFIVIHRVRHTDKKANI